MVTQRSGGRSTGDTYRIQGGANGQAKSTPLMAYQVVGVVRLLVRLVGLPINWYSAGAWIHLAVWLTDLSLAVLVIRNPPLERYDPWVEREVWVNASS